MLIAALFTIARTQKQPRCPSTDFKAQHSENEDHGIQSHHFMGNRWGNSENKWLTLFFWAPKSLQMVTAAMKLKDAYSLEGKL